MKKFGISLLVMMVAFLGVTNVAAMDDYYSYEDQQEVYLWAKAKNITTTPTLRDFRPLADVTRDEFAAIVYRAFQNNIFTPGISVDVREYRDQSRIAREFREPIMFLQKYGIMRGDSNGNFRPKDKITLREVLILGARAMGAQQNFSDRENVDFITRQLDLNTQTVRELNAPADRITAFDLMKEASEVKWGSSALISQTNKVSSQKNNTTSLPVNNPAASANMGYQKMEMDAISDDWRLVSFQMSGKKEIDVMAKNIILDIDDERKFYLKVCNHISGDIFVNRDKDGSFIITQKVPGTSTLMACQGVEGDIESTLKLDGAVAKVYAHRATDKDYMVITTKDGTVFKFIED